MSPYCFVRRAALGLLLLVFPAFTATAGPLRLSPEEEATLRKKLPKTMAKLQARELLRVVSVGDSISTFYQPPGFPRYDSAMSWQGSLLNRLGGYYFYLGIVDVDPHRELAQSQKEADASLKRFQSEMDVWQRSKKGPEPEAPDALRFKADLATPNAMPVASLIGRNLKGSQLFGTDGTIQILNLARDGSVAAQALEALGPNAFPAIPAAPAPAAPNAAPAGPPDLVTICYGVNDAIGGLPLSGYRQYLTEAIAICRKNKSEVLLAAPPVSFDRESPRESIGRTRPYAQVAEEVARATGVAFVDLGIAMVEAPSDLQSLTAAEAFAAAIVPVSRAFEYRSEVVDTLHPNASATSWVGEHAARQLMGSTPKGQIDVSGGVDVTGPDQATAIIRLFNPTTAARAVVVSPLSFTGWRVKPGTADAYYNLPPGKARRFNIPLEPITTGPAPDNGAIRGSLIISDDDLQQLVDVSLPLTPLAISWPEGRFDGETGDMLLTATLTNQGLTPVKGTASLQWMGRSLPMPVQLEPKQSLPLPLRLMLPETSAAPRFSELATVTVSFPRDTGPREVAFRRRVEGTRHLGLEQRIPLQNPNNPSTDPDTFVTPFADARGIYFIIESPASGGNSGAAGSPWGVVDVQLDGRKAGENGTAGFVDRLSATIPWSDGPVALRKVRPAVFGSSYFYDYHPDGFRVTANTRADSSRRIEFNIARVNLIQHEWSLDGSGQASLGFNLRIGRTDPVSGQPDPDGVRVIASSPFGGNDARSLTQLELSRTPAPRWSVRVY